ncbi:hypothetical protein EDM68_01905 [Candidatus Uhrbacteria bacterium]|nr:MAG: hypothetical protein EDM68_01905 [Candidatus Uhrbacteria bacterium]
MKKRSFFSRVPRWSMAAWISILAGLALLCFFFAGSPPPADTDYGFTWSITYARTLGLDPDRGLETALRDLAPDRIRIPAYWREIEAKRGTYDFSALDRQLDIAARFETPVILAVGSRVPRWPECWEPDWAARLSDVSERHRVQLAYLVALYARYKDHPAVAAWQVENESFFDYYAACPGLTRGIVLDEMRFVRGEEAKRDTPRPVYTTDSGEWSLWIGFAGETDGVGVSVYRAVATEYFGTLRHWYITPMLYWRKAQLLKPFIGEVYISEMQMEPWTLREIQNTPLLDQFKTFDLAQMERSFRYATRLGLPAVDFWGVEWWLWMKETQGHPEFWEKGKAFFDGQR